MPLWLWIRHIVSFQGFYEYDTNVHGLEFRCDSIASPEVTARQELTFVDLSSLDVLSTLFVWTIIARSEIGTGVQLDPEVMRASRSYHWVVASAHCDVLAADHVGE